MDSADVSARENASATIELKNSKLTVLVDQDNIEVASLKGHVEIEIAKTVLHLQQQLKRRVEVSVCTEDISAKTVQDLTEALENNGCTVRWLEPGEGQKAFKYLLIRKTP